MDHAYPEELARFVLRRWEELHAASLGCQAGFELPAPHALTLLLSTAYQATLLQEEARAVTFRLILGDPERFPSDAGPPDGLHRLTFRDPRPFTEHELRRLSPAVKYHRALIGVRSVGQGGFQIWGILQSGPRWMQASRGGRGLPSTLPPDALVIRAIGPGCIAVAKGSVPLAEMRGGAISFAAMDVFESRWLGEKFEGVRSELVELHEQAAARAGVPWAPLDAEVTRLIAQQMIKRLISTMRSAHHGGTVVILPPDSAQVVELEERLIRLKYKFLEAEPRQRYRTLMLAIMRTLAESVASESAPAKLGWSAYIASTSHSIARLDEAILELSHLIAGLADVDGAVVLNKRFELLGFGGEIGGDLPDVISVERALDIEGRRRQSVLTEGVGTRHRSAYRLCQRVHDAVVIVVSQDSGVRFITWLNGAVTYWDHAAPASPEG